MAHPRQKRHEVADHSLEHEPPPISVAEIQIAVICEA
jgi:hypothetical protein